MTDTTNSGTPAADQSDQTAAAAQDMQQEQQAPVTQEVKQGTLSDTLRAIGQSSDPAAELAKHLTPEQAERGQELLEKAAAALLEPNPEPLTAGIMTNIQDIVPSITGLQNMMQSVMNALTEYQHAETASIIDALGSTIQNLHDATSTIIDRLSNISFKIDFDSLSKLLDDLNEHLKRRENYLKDLTPYLQAELEQLHAEHPETAEITLDDITVFIDIQYKYTDTEIEEMIQEFEENPIDSAETDPVMLYLPLVLKAIQKAINEYTVKKEQLQLLLPILQSRLPKNHTMPINRLANELQRDLINAGAVDLVVAGRGKKGEITSYVLATYEQPDGITMTGKPYTEYDRQVQDAVSSLWEYGDETHIITPDMVFRAMTHRTQTESPSPQQIGAVTKSLEKMRRIHITVDATEEMKKRKLTIDGKQVTSCKFDDYLLSLRAVEVKAGGRTVKAYLMTAEPVLLTYAKLTKQLATVPAELLDIKKVDKGKATTVSVANSDARIAVKGYILRRIAIIKHDKTAKNPKQSNIIKFDSLFAETGIPQDSNSANIKKYAFQVLDYYTATGYIQGYTKRKKAGKGGGIDAILITV